MTPEPVDVHQSARIDDAVAYRLYRTNRLMLTHLARFLAAEDGALTPEQWFLLARVLQDGPVRQVDLTDPTLGDPPNVSRLVDALSRVGLVTRQPDPGDRRTRLVTVTAKGREVAEHLMAQAVAVRREVFDGFDAAELAQLIDILDRLDARMRLLLAPD